MPRKLYLNESPTFRLSDFGVGVVCSAVVFSAIYFGWPLVRSIPQTFATFPASPAFTTSVAEPGSSLSVAINTAEIDSELRREIQSVVHWLQDYTFRNDRFPSYGDEMSWAEGQLALLVPGNPYQ